MAKEKLELQVNIPTTIKLLQSDPATGENNYGKWFLYNVECSGSEYSYFAPEKVVNLLRQQNVCQDEEVVITKKLIKNGKKNITDYEVHVLETTPAEIPITNGRTNGYNKNGIDIPQNGQMTESSANGNGVAHTIDNGNGLEVDAAPVLSKDYPVMLNCMTEAMMIRDELGHDVDVNKLGITLFLRKVKP